MIQALTKLKMKIKKLIYFIETHFCMIKFQFTVSSGVITN